MSITEIIKPIKLWYAKYCLRGLWRERANLNREQQGINWMLGYNNRKKHAQQVKIAALEKEIVEAKHAMSARKIIENESGMA